MHHSIWRKRLFYVCFGAMCSVLFHYDLWRSTHTSFFDTVAATAAVFVTVFFNWKHQEWVNSTICKYASIEEKTISNDFVTFGTVSLGIGSSFQLNRLSVYKYRSLNCSQISPLSDFILSIGSSIWRGKRIHSTTKIHFKIYIDKSFSWEYCAYFWK